jgi:hypothetical protein
LIFLKNKTKLEKLLQLRDGSTNTDPYWDSSVTGEVFDESA